MMEIQGPSNSASLVGLLSRANTPREHGHGVRHQHDLNAGHQGARAFLRGRFTFGSVNETEAVNKFGNARIQFGSNGRFRMIINGPDGRRNTLSGLKVDDDIFLRRPNGDIIQVDMIKDEETGEFGFFGMQRLSAPATSQEDLASSTLLTFTGEGTQFESSDGSMVGKYEPGSGRISGTVTTQEGNELHFEGLVGDGFVALGLSNGNSINVAFTPLQDGSYILRGFEEALAENGFVPDGVPEEGPKILGEASASEGVGPLQEDPLNSLFDLFGDDIDTPASSVDAYA